MQTSSSTLETGASAPERRPPVKPALGRFGAALAELFPGPGAPLGARAARPVVVAGYLVAWIAGAFVLLARYTGVPFTKTIYAEDLPVWLAEALAHPGSNIFSPYAGYLQLVPRLIGQSVALMPVGEAAAAFAIIGSLVASGCAVFVFHVSSGHIRNIWLRLLAGLSVLLLPVALLQIAASGVNTPWYLEMALFWALLWRPPTRTGVALAAVIGFATASSNITATVFGLLVVARVIALPRLREHAVSLGWLAGCLAQVPYFVHTYTSTSSSARLSHPLAGIGPSTAFYGHDVVLPAFGWHLSWVLREWWDRNYALIAVGAVLTLIVAAVVILAGARIRMFTVAALVFGFAFTVFAADVAWWVTINTPHPDSEPGARYTCLPILLITAVLIVAADGLLVSRPGVRRLSAIAATLGLIGVLCIGWIPDFRYASDRSNARMWAPVATEWLRTCDHHTVVRFWDTYADNHILLIPCGNIHR